MRRYRALAALTAGLMLLSTAAIADTADGDFAAGGKTISVDAGASFTLGADLFIVRQSAGQFASAVTWGAPALTGSCAGISGTPNPAGFAMPDTWADVRPFGTTSRQFDPTKVSPVTIAGTAGVAGGSCTLRYTTNSAGIQGGENSRVEFTINFVEPAGPVNTPPTITSLVGLETVEESNTAERVYTFSFTDPDENLWTFAANYPTCGGNGELVTNSAAIDPDEQTGSFSCIFDDGPAESTVAVKIFDETDYSDEATLDVDVLNVVPTATLTRVGPANVFTGATVTYGATATDPSEADTDYGFYWSYNEGAYSATASSTSQLTQTYSKCGAFVESVVARDKDGGESEAATAGVTVFDGSWHGAIKPAMRNMVQKGRVVPVQVRVGCEGMPLAGLSPTIQLVTGDLDPDTEPESGAVLVPTSVSGADTTGFMRAADGGYIYNLQIPSNATAGQRYTIRVRPWGTDGAALNAVLEIRK
jgi:hypothetical protein